MERRVAYPDFRRIDANKLPSNMYQYSRMTPEQAKQARAQGPYPDFRRFAAARKAQEEAAAAAKAERKQSVWSTISDLIETVLDLRFCFIR